MITDLIITVLLTPVEWVLSAVPHITWPTWFATSGAGSVVVMAQGWGNSVGTLNGWFPVGEFFDAAGIVFIAMAVSITVRAVRMLVSAVTGGGGSAS